MKKSDLSLNALILRSFFDQPNLYVSGVALAEEAGVSRAAIWKHIEQLQTQGYVIEAQPHHGYRLLQSPDLLSPDEFMARQPTKNLREFSWKPLFLKETPSTNDVAWLHAQQGEAEGFFAAADKQTQGRGRQGRKWESPPNAGLYCSLLLRPRWSIKQLTRLTIMASVALAEALESLTGKEIRIKWPNDLFLNRKKLAGILSEIQTDPETIRFAVLGFGINLNHESEDFSPEVRSRATSLRIETDQNWRRLDVLLAALDSIKKIYFAPFEKTVEQWTERCLTLGQTITVQTAAGKKQGQAMGLDEDGALLLREESGKIEPLFSGDIIKTG